MKVLDELETKVEPAVHELRLGWSTDDTDMQLGKYFTLLCHLEPDCFEYGGISIIIGTFILT